VDSSLKKYISFRKQYEKCLMMKSRQKQIYCYHCGKDITLCTKYNDICSSKKCLPERLKGKYV
jgi:hypothetical protein